MTTADRRKVLDMLAEGKISADEAERLLKALGRQRSDGPDMASMVEEGLNMVTDVVERLSVDMDDTFERLCPKSPFSPEKSESHPKSAPVEASYIG